MAGWFLELRMFWIANGKGKEEMGKSELFYHRVCRVFHRGTPKYFLLKTIQKIFNFHFTRFNGFISRCNSGQNSGFPPSRE